MLTFRDFLDYCDLTEAEVDAIARREHVPPILAAQLALRERELLAKDSRTPNLARDPTRPFSDPRHPPRHPLLR